VSGAPEDVETPASAAAAREREGAGAEASTLDGSELALAASLLVAAPDEFVQKPRGDVTAAVRPLLAVAVEGRRITLAVREAASQPPPLIAPLVLLAEKERRTTLALAMTGPRAAAVKLSRAPFTALARGAPAPPTGRGSASAEAPDGAPAAAAPCISAPIAPSAVVPTASVRLYPL
jgi:hypothetical protein